MTRKSFLATFFAMLAIVAIGMIAGTKNAAAQQNPNCCTYTVNIQNVIDACLPIKLTTRWNCNPGTLSKTYGSVGSYIEPINPPLLPPCPPACRLLAISIDGVNFIGPNQTKQITMGHCCYILSFTFDANGCIVINIRGC